MAFVLDTCVWIDVERGHLAPADVAALTRDQDVYLSPVTLAELRFGADSAADASLRQRRLVALSRLERKPLLVIDAATAVIFGMLAAHLKAASRQPRHRVQDLWLASQAIQHAYQFLTRNPQDFIGLPGLDLLTYRLARTPEI